MRQNTGEPNVRRKRDRLAVASFVDDAAGEGFDGEIRLGAGIAAEQLSQDQCSDQHSAQALHQIATSALKMPMLRRTGRSCSRQKLALQALTPSQRAASQGRCLMGPSACCKMQGLISGRPSCTRQGRRAGLDRPPLPGLKGLPLQAVKHLPWQIVHVVACSDQH